MRKLFQLVLALLLMTATGHKAAAKALESNERVIVERIIAIVNGRAILASDWEDAVRYEAFMESHALGALTADDWRKTLDRLIDQELLRQQMQAFDFQQATPEEVRQRIQEIRKQYPGGKTDESWHVALQSFGLSEQDLGERVALQLGTLRFIDARLRPSVHVDSPSIETYYREKLLPELRQAGSGQTSLAEVSPKIEEILYQQRIDELLAAWLRNLREQSEIRIAAPPEPGHSQAEAGKAP